MNEDMLAHLRHVMRGDGSADTSRVGVKSEIRYASKLAELRQLRLLRPNDDQQRNEQEGRARLEVTTPSDGDEIDERAGLVADQVDPVYRYAWARLNHQKPVNVSEAAWRQALDDGGRFLDAWGQQAAGLGWRAHELFSVSAGLVWKLAGAAVEALKQDDVRLSDGRILPRSAELPTAVVQGESASNGADPWSVAEFSSLRGVVSQRSTRSKKGKGIYPLP
jgi:hypothetical protein